MLGGGGGGEAVLHVLAGTCEFCFCPQYCEKNIQILKDRHFCALELP